MKRTLASIIGAAALFAGSYGVASAASLADLQSQLRAILAQIATIQSQQQVTGSWAIGSAFSATSTNASGTAPDSCKVWYDGCNTCTRATPGGPLSCSNVQCIWNAGSSCKQYFDSNSGSGSGASGTPRICTLPYYRLGYGARGDLVSALQSFLQSEGTFSATATGYFGPATQAALQKWQASQGVVSSGSVATTGWGSLGPATWRAILKRCTYPTPTIPIPSNTFAATPLSGSAPLTVSFTAEGYANSWTDANGNTVSVSDRGDRYIDFGDGSAALKIVCTNPTSMTCSYAVSHTYSSNGTYTAKLFTAGYFGIPNDTTYGTRNDVASQTITVGTPVACTLQYQPVCGRPSGCMNTCPAGQMCPMYCRLADPQTYGNRCELDAAGATYISDGACSTAANQPPAISGITGPTTLSVNQQGTWTVNASDPENQSLSYQVTWGDERAYPAVSSAVASSPVNYQTATFTHTYASAGTYTVHVTATDSQGASSATSITVVVGSGSVVCTEEYAPVCGQPPEPACRHTPPYCMIATPGPQTYGNRCMLNAAGAAYLYDGACTSY